MKPDLSEKQQRIMEEVGLEQRRNDALFDLWSLLHIVWGMLLTWWLGPLWALSLLILWEPLEILVLGPILKRLFNITFGYESLRNSLSDIVFDSIGILLVTLLL